MHTTSISKPRLAIAAGGIIIAAATNAVVQKTGGYFTAHALLVVGLAIGVFVAAYVLPQAWQQARAAAVVTIFALVAGEAYNLLQTAERIVIVREEAQAPLRAQKQAHDDAKAALAAAEAAAPVALTVAGARVTVAREELAKALKAYSACRGSCTRQQASVSQARIDLRRALEADAGDAKEARAEAEAKRTAAIADARTRLEAAKAPPSATPLADRLGWQPWALDLLLAALLSVGANGLAATLVAYGAVAQSGDTTGQSDFSLSGLDSTNVVRLMRPGNGPARLAGRTDGTGNTGPDRPKPPAPKSGPSGGLSKSEAFDDLMQRLSDGQTIPSQDVLASDWHRPKQTVSDWMREWRRIGVIPAAVPAGRCKATVPA